MKNETKSRKEKISALISLIIMVGGIIIFSSFIIKGYSGNDVGSISKYGFIGDGTKDSPYLISSIEDLEHFRDLVNEGESFIYRYFKQTEDLDLAVIDNWIPIGIFGSDKYFYGYYDGGGHTLSNLKCKRPEDFNPALDFNVGLFGVLCGEVRNLGIESGLIDGFCVGAIASHGTRDAVIINCYNKAIINGYRAGGIADNFMGTILFCFNLGQVSGEESAGIVSYDAKEIYSCYSTTDNLVTENYTGSTNRSMTIENQDMDAAFIRNYYKTLKEWNSGYIDKDNLCNIVIENGDIQYANSLFFGLLEQFSVLEILIVILIVVMFTLIECDYIINVRRQIRGVHE